MTPVWANRTLCDTPVWAKFLLKFAVGRQICVPDLLNVMSMELEVVKVIPVFSEWKKCTSNTYDCSSDVYMRVPYEQQEFFSYDLTPFRSK